MLAGRVCARCDLAFKHDPFQAFLPQYEIIFRLEPPPRHNKSLLESNHGVIRAIFLCFCNASPDSYIKSHAVGAVCISIEMYGTDTLLLFEIENGYTELIKYNAVLHQSISQELLDSHNELKAKHKPMPMLHCHVPKEICVNACDLVQFSVRKEDYKRGKWSCPHTVLSIKK